MENASEIIAALGGTSAVARELELPPSTVSSWKTGSGIPKWRMPGIRLMADRLGVDLNCVHVATGRATRNTPSPGNAVHHTAPQQSEAA